MDQYVLAFIAVCALIMILLISAVIVSAIRNRQKMTGGEQPINTNAHRHRYIPQGRAMYMDTPVPNLFEQQPPLEQHQQHKSESSESAHHHPTSTPDVSVH